MELRNLKILAFLLFVHLFETTQLEKMLTNGTPDLRCRTILPSVPTYLIGTISKPLFCK